MNASGLRLEGKMCSMLTAMLGGDLDVKVRVRVYRDLHLMDHRLGLGLELGLRL